MIFFRESSPHDRSSYLSTSFIMFMTFFCLIPAVIIHVLSFGYGILIHLLLAIPTASIFEALMLKLRGYSICHGLKDFSIQVTTIIYCLAIPPYLSWWLTIIGIVFATIVVKHCFGGLGQNVFNPAMVAYILLLICAPNNMNSWVEPTTQNLEKYNVYNSWYLISENNEKVLTNLDLDGSTYASPLGSFKIVKNENKTFSYISNFLNYEINNNGINAICYAFVLGGIILIILKIITIIQPLFFLISVYVFGLLYNYLGTIYGFSSITAQDHLMLGGTMICAFFIITDPVSAPTTNIGRITSVIIIGFFLVTIRTFGSYPDAVAFASLLGNAFNPLINRICVPHRFGYKGLKQL